MAAAWPLRWIGRRWWWRWRTSDLAAAVSQTRCQARDQQNNVDVCTVVRTPHTKETSTAHQCHKLAQTTDRNRLQVAVYLAPCNEREGTIPWRMKDQLDVTCYFISLLMCSHVSDINISIIRSLRLCCWITTSVVLFSVRCVLKIWWGWFWVVFVLQAEALLCCSWYLKPKWRGSLYLWWSLYPSQ